MPCAHIAIKYTGTARVKFPSNFSALFLSNTVNNVYYRHAVQPYSVRFYILPASCIQQMFYNLHAVL
jgi:hypothetical protein